MVLYLEFIGEEGLLIVRNAVILELFSKPKSALHMVGALSLLSHCVLRGMLEAKDDCDALSAYGDYGREDKREREREKECVWDYGSGPLWVGGNLCFFRFVILLAWHQNLDVGESCVVVVPLSDGG